VKTGTRIIYNLITKHRNQGGSKNEQEIMKIPATYLHAIGETMAMIEVRKNALIKRIRVDADKLEVVSE
jgi:hypothetical protein